MKRLTYIAILLMFVSCSQNDKSNETIKTDKANVQSTDSLVIGESHSLKKVRGQVLYLPVYSNIPYFNNTRILDLSAFIAFHNTDFNHSLTISRVQYYDNNGNLVKIFVTKPIIIKPLAATNFFVPESDKSGTGANFILEWYADTLVNEPLIESVMTGLRNNLGVSFLSTGKVVRELK